MRKTILYICIVVLIVLTIIGISACDEEANDPKSYVIEFSAQHPGGKIEGNSYQVVKEGASTEKVVAVADTWYYFAGWADLGYYNTDQSVMCDERIIENVQEDRHYMALFEKRTQLFEGDVKTYTYDYKFADSNCDKKTISLTYGHLENTVFDVPSRSNAKFGGWYADRFLTKKVSDEFGNIVIGDDFLYEAGTTLYAKWISQNTNKYKILMAYVTEINANLTKKDNSGTVPLNYKMTDVERQVCHMVTEQFAFELNDLAIADFQVDEYFTTTPITQETMRVSRETNGKIDNNMRAQDVKEIQHMFDDYDCIILSYSFHDYISEFKTNGGFGGAQFASLSFDICVANLIAMDRTLEELLDPNCDYWDPLLSTYFHEFCHTIEMKVTDMIAFHTVLGEYLNTGFVATKGHNYPAKLYLLNKAKIDENTVGVPYEYWERKVATVHYAAQEGGHVHATHPFDRNPTYGQNPADHIEYVIYGQNAVEVEAVAYEGWEFVEWSDGVKSSKRQERNLYGNFYVYAIFRRIDVR